MAKTVRLSLHRNTIEAKRKRELAGAMSKQIPALVRDVDVRAYAFVALDSQGASHCLWDTGGIVPMWGLPGMVQAMLWRDMEASGVEEDWKPPVR